MEVARVLVASKLINTVAKCAHNDEQAPLLTQIYVHVYNKMVMIAALDGFCMAMRKVAFDEEALPPHELDEAQNNYDTALSAIGERSWMFPADLKIPNGQNVLIMLYDDYSVVMKTSVAVYGPFQKIGTLEGTQSTFDIRNVYRYPPGAHGSSRAVNAAKMAKVVSALADKRDTLIINAAGGPKDALYIRSSTGEAFGMVLPMRDVPLEGRFFEDLKAAGYNVSIEVKSGEEQA